MPIRCTSKAIIVRDGCILLNRCRQLNGRIYYDLPGGGQHTYETLEDALIREVQEETGYTVEPKSLLFIREGFDNETHRIEFMFICDIISDIDETKLSYDSNQIGTKWLNIDNIRHEELYPVDMRNIIKQYFLGKNNAIYLGKME